MLSLSGFCKFWSQGVTNPFWYTATRARYASATQWALDCIANKIPTASYRVHYRLSAQTSRLGSGFHHCWIHQLFAPQVPCPWWEIHWSLRCFEACSSEPRSDVAAALEYSHHSKTRSRWGYQRAFSTNVVFALLAYEQSGCGRQLVVIAFFLGIVAFKVTVLYDSGVFKRRPSTFCGGFLLNICWIITLFDIILCLYTREMSRRSCSKE